MTSTDSPSAQGYIPGGRVWRSADVSVLIVVVVALIFGVLLRQSNVNATQPATFEGLMFEVPKGAVVQTTTDAYNATAEDGLTARVQKLPAPPSAAGDSGALVASRAMQLGQRRTLFQVTRTDRAQAAGTDAALLSYRYVQPSSRFFATGLQIIVGNELLVPDGKSYYAVALEGPSDKTAELDALWPKIQSSVSLEG